MDALAAAAAAAAMDADGFAGGSIGQRAAPAAAAADDAQLPANEAMDVDKENDAPHAAAGEAEDAASKVSKAKRVPSDTPCVQPLARADSTLALP